MEWVKVHGPTNLKSTVFNLIHLVSGTVLCSICSFVQMTLSRRVGTCKFDQGRIFPISFLVHYQRSKDSTLLKIIANFSFSISLLVWPLLPTLCRCRGFTVAPDHTPLHSFGKTSLNEKLATRRGPYLHKTPHSQKTNIHATAKIRTQSSKKRATAELLLRPRGLRDRLVPFINELKIYKDNNLLTL